MAAPERPKISAVRLAAMACSPSPVSYTHLDGLDIEADVLRRALRLAHHGNLIAVLGVSKIEEDKQRQAQHDDDIERILLPEDCLLYTSGMETAMTRVAPPSRRKKSSTMAASSTPSTMFCTALSTERSM